MRIGFGRGVGHPSVFWHPIRRIMCLVHGDDYVSAGDGAEILWFENELKKVYDLKVQRFGPTTGGEGKVLNRIVRWSEQGWELEADPCHAELIQEQLGVMSG